jgi:hypothetical protein
MLTGKKRVLRLLLCLAAVGVLAGPAAAAQAPIAAQDGTPPLLMPFKVWVLPRAENGMTIAGHYEYFSLLVNDGDLKVVLDAPAVAPTLPVVPAAPMAGQDSAPQP